VTPRPPPEARSNTSKRSTGTNGLPAVSLHLHDLRHAFATLLLDQGVELRTVMELLGHSTIRLTADTYGHVLPTKVKGASDLMDGLLGEAR
jgi:site-specific recombinase XerD